MYGCGQWRREERAKSALLIQFILARKWIRRADHGHRLKEKWMGSKGSPLGGCPEGRALWWVSGRSPDTVLSRDYAMGQVPGRLHCLVGEVPELEGQHLKTLACLSRPGRLKGRGRVKPS